MTLDEREGTRGWQPPPDEGTKNASARQAWIDDVIACGEQTNAASLAGRDIINAIEMVSGREQQRPNQQRSDLRINRGKRALREVIANLSNVRAVDGYSSDNPSFQGFLAMLNKVWKAVYFESRYPRTLHRACCWMAAGGYSYISPGYRNLSLNSRSRRAITFATYSANDVLTFQMPDDNNLQGCYAVTMMDFLPEYEAHAKFPKFQSQLRPIARRRYSGNAAKERLALAERFRTSTDAIRGDGPWSALYDEIRRTYIRDLSINETKKPVAMGSPGALESYIVPYVGMELPTGEMNKGVRVMRKAEEEDCFLYPNLRLLISQKGMRGPLYDGPAFSWHGLFPLARLTADEWPWEPGYSLVRDIYSIESNRTSFLRGLDQTAKQRFDPAIMYDKNAGINRKTMETFDPYEERGRLGVEGEVSDKIVRTLLPESLLSIPEWAMAWYKLLDESEDYMLGLNALNNLAKAKIAGAGDAAEKAMEEAGPIVKDISRGMELMTAELMEMVLYDVMQYYPTGRIMQYVGPDGISIETFDFDPAALTPSHGPDEDAANGTSIYTRQERTKQFCSNIHAQVTPGSLHGIVQTPQKLLLMQLYRAGFPIPPDMVANALDIPNFGLLEGNTVLERWQSWKKLELTFAAQMRELASALLPQGAMAPQPAGGGKGGGRPPSGKKPPEAATKGSAEGQRGIVKES